MGKIIAVTGAAGYLGRVLIAQLQAQPWVERIVALDFKPLPADGRLISYQMDVRESSLLRAILAEHGVTHFIHAAFMVSQLPGFSEDQVRQNNVEGSQQVIRTALDLGVEQLLFVSSVAIYGYRNGQPFNVREDGAWQPNWVYGRHKAAVEGYLNEQRSRFPKTHITIIRPAAIGGPLGHLVSPLRALTAQRIFIVSNGGRALTQAIHEEDAAALIVKAVEQTAAGTFNAASNDYASWAEIGVISRMRVLSAPRSVLNFAARFNQVLPPLHGFTREIVDYFSESLVVDNLAARQTFNWMPRYSTLDTFGQLFGTLHPTHERVRAER